MMKPLLILWLLLTFTRILALAPDLLPVWTPFTDKDPVSSPDAYRINNPVSMVIRETFIPVLTAIADSAATANAEPVALEHPVKVVSEGISRRPGAEYSPSADLSATNETDSRHPRDTLDFRGQLSVWAGLNPSGDLPLRLGGRIIPQVNYGVFLRSQKQVDFEVSVNAWGNSILSLFDSLRSEGELKVWRAWARFSGKQYELRAGLQKINFGSASMLRPLMWFDQMDARDPLQLTDGVWGILGRYYFLNNANVWLWALYGNKGQRAWDVMESAGQPPEFGGRIQIPLLPGEAAFTYHYRKAHLPHYLRVASASAPDLTHGNILGKPDGFSVVPGIKSASLPAYDGSSSVSHPVDHRVHPIAPNNFLSGLFQSDPHRFWPVAAGQAFMRLEDMNDIGALQPPGKEVSLPEHRFALDGKWDIGPGIWFESVWIHNSGNYGILTNQTMLNLGADYTFGIGNGLNLTLEHLIFSYDEKAFAFGNATSFSALSATYPLGMSHHLSTIIYYDWDKQNLYGFLNWRVQLPGFILYSMFFRNPRHLQLPGASSGNQLFSGTGVQVMLVYNL